MLKLLKMLAQGCGRTVHQFFSQILSQRLRWTALVLSSLFVVVACQATWQSESPQTLPTATAPAGVSAGSHNVVLFVADGLRPTSINAADTPTLHELREQGVTFTNSHSLFPTFTTANASAIATGHYLGDTGDFSNTIQVDFPVKSAGNTTLPFLENNAVLREINRRFGANYLNEESLLAMARKAGYSTAAIGKIGPVWIQDITQQSAEPTIIVDDETGKETAVPLSEGMKARLVKVAMPVMAPDRGDNGKPGDFKTPGAKVPNQVQQQYFADTTTKAVLPMFKERNKPFVLVYWSRDPDGTQHNHGDSLNSLTPGINGPTVQAALKNMDQNLAQIRTALRELGLEANTNIFVTADHGFSTISKESKSSYAAGLTYEDAPQGVLPKSFLAIDIAHALDLPLYNPDKANAEIKPKQGKTSRNALIGKNANKPDVIVAANGGSDLIYLPNKSEQKKLARQLVTLLLKQDYVSGLFVNDSLGEIPGTLPFDVIALKGVSRTPAPTMIVNFRSFDSGCGVPTACGVEIADASLQQGQGMHGSFSRADTFNAMVAMGPDFKRGYKDLAPVSNADVPYTLAKVMNLKLPARGKLFGRVIEEALVNGPDTVKFELKKMESAAAGGLKTILRYQVVEKTKTRYFDTAGFPGRTLGLF
jgi:arylsulfatase A-like enzyme